MSRELRRLCEHRTGIDADHLLGRGVFALPQTRKRTRCNEAYTCNDSCKDRSHFTRVGVDFQADLPSYESDVDKSAERMAQKLYVHSTRSVVIPASLPSLGMVVTYYGHRGIIARLEGDTCHVEMDDGSFETDVLLCDVRWMPSVRNDAYFWSIETCSA